ncbi:MAG: 16S rRNA (cytosine(1402)-N(4))-methyltransferase RsmH [Sphaerochaetaceae bacterium]|nr:16S rRNA (cytosine(1402)-N(4))-methyltransferase RsmH [Sphaerochaetaceae bacterium]NLO59589.1 16S rRNA (cytosine(1402)-N(4))-methyltransferase RsmH [Spirochaetales bacterium]MDD2406914.1 16S rRNA (cytosine(1402)-N(4))-methyltransferase RsmH [Sphaerochaetaceae bacterium]MDD3670222.1 16S rRNA (cytosine(1402)-N(4))-methyltransferase RsmH [Sphaerochaetaceae bacterium]MDD4259109.1 16S rRNA (cytosine(1402)-N(4))-methyltransferase RsmH [Sphaerochaetaceae bacterium]
MEILHTSVMLNEVLTHLVPCSPDALMIDCTLGEGGHSEAFLSKYPELKIIGLDRDKDILAKAGQRLVRFSDRFVGYNVWFDEFLNSYDGIAPSMILFDLGISVFHYEASQRGFSFRRNEDLDMRLDKDGDICVSDVVNTYHQEQLADIIYNYGEERYSRRIASGICEYRKSQAITKSDELANIVWKSVPAAYRHGKLHPATKTFQALRIEVNQELKRISSGVKRAVEIVRPGGRVAVISFHSLEDRPVKYIFKQFAQACICPPDIPKCECSGTPTVKLITKKPLVPTEEECRSNPPSRSAKLRVVEKLEQPL